MPKVCFIWTSPDLLHLLLDRPSFVGGAELQLRELGRHLRGGGWDVSYVVSDCGQGDGVVTADGFTLYGSYPPQRRLPAADMVLTKAPRLASAVRRAAADVYIQRGAAWYTHLCAATAHRIGAPFVFWMASNEDGTRSHRPWWRPEGRLHGRGLREADLLIAQTDEQADVLRTEWGLESKVLRNLWPVEPGRPARSGVPECLWVANLAPRKRPELLLELARLRPEWQFTMVGGPTPGADDYYSLVQHQAEAIRNVSFVGRVAPEEIAAYYSRVWALVSTSESEGFSNVYLHAWACGTPVIAVLDPDEVICRYGLGYHCSSVGEMAQRLSALGSDAATRERIGDSARDYIRSHHAPEAIVPRLDALLRQLIEARR